MEREASRSRAITELVERFARDTGLNVITKGVEKHGSYEWASGRTDTLIRFVVLDIWDEPTFEDGSLNSAEIWVIAEQDISYVRKISSKFRISWPARDEPLDEINSA